MLYLQRRAGRLRASAAGPLSSSVPTSWTTPLRQLCCGCRWLQLRQRRNLRRRRHRHVMPRAAEALLGSLGVRQPSAK